MLSKLTTDQKGAVAESAVVHSAIKLGLGVFKPLSDVERYDLILRVGERLVRVQCKWAVRRGDVIEVRCRSCRRGPDGFIKRHYTPEEIDAIAAYCLDVDRCYFLPLDRFPQRRAIQLRLAATRNNQRLGVNWTRDWEFERLDWDAALGP